MNRFKRINVVLGWIVFAIAAVVYSLTMEPTVSFWDCPEFITTAYKLEIGHPPGYPFFSLVGHLFSLFASTPAQVSTWVNRISVLNSSGAVLFLFWTISMLARNILVKKEDDYTWGKMLTVWGAALVGSLAFAFTDSFWFSATETDVFSFAALSTAFSFWAMLRWSEVADEPHSDRWLLLIAYAIGISIGVHLLSLLTIPALVMIFYFRKHQHTKKSAFLAFIVAISILAAVFYGMIPSFFWLSSFLELFFVNTLGLPYNSGVIAYALIVVAVFAWAIYASQKGKSEKQVRISFILAIALSGIPFLGKSVWVAVIVLFALIYLLLYKRVYISRRIINMIVLGIAMILIGYSQFAVVLIRSSAQPPMDEDAPSDVFALMSYQSREQYGDIHPLLYGPMYTADYKYQPSGNGMCAPVQKQGSPIWNKKPKTHPGEKDQYIITGYKQTPVYDPVFYMFFPRMFSDQPNHVQAYESWVGKPDINVDYSPCGQDAVGKMPSFGQNLKFFFSYQLNFMYFRYFMWNFSGRQNDKQSYGEIDRGNWITGFNFIDKWLVGDQSTLPQNMKDNKGRHTYYMLPLIMGIIGFLFLLMYAGKQGKHTFWIVFTLFFMTGVAIIIYLNQTPLQPRERDYSYTGSFYAYCIFIGFGVLAIANYLQQRLSSTLSAIIATLIGLIIPGILISQNWASNDRAGRYTAQDFGANYLNSLAPNAIIFTNGDNDTFPLWYSIEVMGLRPDVRVCNLSYLQTDWYIAQMKRQAYTSAPLPISWTPSEYAEGNHDVAYVADPKDTTKIDLSLALQFVLSTNPQTKDPLGHDIFPTSHLIMKVDKQQVLKTHTVDSTLANQIVPVMNITLRRQVTKADMMILDMLQTNQWVRPIYFANTVGNDMYLGMSNYFQQEGIAQRIVPIWKEGGTVNTKVMYDNMMHKFRFGNVKDPKVYLDENILRMCTTFRMQFVTLAEALIAENKRDSALQVLNYAMQELPPKTVPNDYFSTFLAGAYYELGKMPEGDAILNDVANKSSQDLTWYAALTPKQMNTVTDPISTNLATLRNALYYFHQYNRKALMDKYYPKFEQFVNVFHVQP
jgi:MFS family permease